MSGWPFRPKPPVPPPTDRTIQVIVRDVENDDIDGARVTLDVNGPVEALTVNGLATLTIPVSLADTQLGVYADGYVDVDQHLVVSGVVQIWVGGGTPDPITLCLPPMQKVAPPHVDPSNIPLETLAKFRGAMWTNRAAIPYGPRPGQASNINAMDYYEWYGPDDRALMLKNYKAQGYTHAVTGPMIDPGGYHGQYPSYPGPLTQGHWDHYLDAMQEWWDAGIAPVHFAVTDDPTVNIDANMAMLETFFVQERAQRLLRIVVLAWEPSPWYSADFVKVAQWTARVFPKSLRGLHLWPDHNAPAQSSEMRPGFEEAQMWAAVAPYIHFFHQQTAETFDGTDEQRAYQLAMWNPAMEGSWVSRFSRGYAGWPTFSAFGNRGIMPFPSEYYSFPCYWRDLPESVALAWGDSCMSMGASGYLDGGTV